MKKLLALLDNLPAGMIGGIALVMTGIVGSIDYLIGHEISTALFYLLPVSLAAWYGGRGWGYASSVLAAVIWLVTDIGGGGGYSHPAILPWNSFVRLVIFLLVARLLATLRTMLHAEALAADTDPLTGAFNWRGFRTRLEEEHARSRRFDRRFSLAYLDIDDFKRVNDTRGHSEGDRLLVTLVRVLKDRLRHTDVVARLGGDEFAVLFPETTASEVHDAFLQLRHQLTRRMQESGWPVSFSIGVVYFEELPETPEQALAISDALMYRVKRSTKNNLVCETWLPVEQAERTGTD